MNPSATPAPCRKEQVIVDPHDSSTSDWAQTSSLGYRAVTSAVRFNGRRTLLHVTAENDAGGTVLSMMNYTLSPVKKLNFEDGYFTLPFYISSSDVIRWNATGGLTLYYAVGNEEALTNYVMPAIPSSDLTPGWNYFLFPTSAAVLSGDQYANYLVDPLSGGTEITAQVEKVRTRIDLSVAGQISVGTSIDTIDTTADTVSFTTAHEMADGDALFFTATTVPGGTSEGVPYFVSVVDSTTVQLYTEPELTNLVDLSSAGTSVDALYTPKIYFGPLSYGLKRRTQVCITIDDTQVETYTEWYEGASLAAGENLKDLGWPATAFFIENTLDGVNGCSTAQLEELYNAGWLIGNHSADGDLFTDITTSEVTSNLQSCKDTIQSNGWGAGNIAAYPGGRFRDTTDDLSDAILSATQSAGIRYARTTATGVQSKGALPVWIGRQASHDSYLGLRIHGLPCDASNSPADFLATLDLAITVGIPLVCIVLHKIEAGATGSNISPTDADALIAGLKTRKAGGDIDIVALDVALDDLEGSVVTQPAQIIGSMVS